MGSIIQAVPDELYYDTETRSECDLRKSGSFKYARDPSTELLMFQYAEDDGDIKIIDIEGGEKIPARVIKHLTDPRVKKVGANNIGFDNQVLEHVAGIYIPPEQCFDILQVATLYNLPTNLGGLAKALKLPEEFWKDSSGKDWIKLFSIPQPANSKLRKAGHKYADRTTHPQEYGNFLSYGGQDIETTRACKRALPTWNTTDFEMAVMHADARINDRGIRVDRRYLTNVIKLTDRAATGIKEQIRALTGGVNATQRDKFKDWVNAVWPEARLMDTQAATIDKMLEVRKDMPDVVRKVFNLSRVVTASSIAKFKKILAYLCDDDRLRGMVRYGGAGATMRWAGVGPQLQNVTRGSEDASVISAFITTTLMWRSEADDWMLMDNYFKVAQSCIRGAMVSSRGHAFRDADWSSMEGRGLAWVTGETTILEAYEEGKNLYYLNGVNMFNIPYAEMSKKHKLYMVCKVTELSMGYAGGVAAFAGMARNYRLDLEELANGLYDQEAIPEWAYSQANKLYHNPRFRKQVAAAGVPKPVWLALDSVKRMWRAGRPKTVQFWRHLNDCCFAAVENPGQVYTCGYDGMLAVDVVQDGNGSDWLRIRLPSGRYLSYMWPKISGRKEKKEKEPVSWVAQQNDAGDWEMVAVYDEEGEEDEDEDEGDEDDLIVSFWSFGKEGLRKRYAHGGVFCNNVVQGLCRDLLAHKIVESEREKWQWVLHVHDQGIADLPLDDPRGEKETSEFMCRLADWARRKDYPMPIEADADITLRFNKG